MASLGTTTYSDDNLLGVPGSPGAIRQTTISFNNAADALAAIVTALQNSANGDAGLAIDTNFDVKNGTAIEVTYAGVSYPLAANTSFDTGTAAVITADKWGIGICCYDGSTATFVWADDAANMAYADEATAIAALGTGNLIPSATTPIGYVTVQTHSGDTWTAGTDALFSGTGGNVAAATHYYNDPTLNGTYGIGALSVTAVQKIGDLSGTAITA